MASDRAELRLLVAPAPGHPPAAPPAMRATGAAASLNTEQLLELASVLMPGLLPLTSDAANAALPMVMGSALCNLSANAPLPPPPPLPDNNEGEIAPWLAGAIIYGGAICTCLLSMALVLAAGHSRKEQGLPSRMEPARIRYLCGAWLPSRLKRGTTLPLLLLVASLALFIVSDCNVSGRAYIHLRLASTTIALPHPIYKIAALGAQSECLGEGEDEGEDEGEGEDED